MIKSFNKLIFSFLSVILCIAYCNAMLQSPEDRDDPCQRACNANTTQMICEYQWTIEWYSVLSKACLDCPFNATSCFNKDCVFTNGVYRPLITVNRMLPGPSIVVCQGDSILVHVHNNLHSAEGISIHWHGIPQRGTPFYDGVNMITQCPIISHTTFDYMFDANEIGTHLWHAHSGLQRADGVFGALIIRDYEQDNPYLNTSQYDYDLPEHIITVNDWINDTVIAKFSGHHHNDGDNKPSSILINGKGILKEFVDNNGKKFYTPRAVFSVKQGNRYRFRLINAGVLYCPIEFSIDNHNLTVIASDGKYFDPYEVESLVLYAGERYDFIVNANQSEIQDYWIRTKGYADCQVFGVYQTAILRYYTESVDLISNTTTSFPFSYRNMTRKGLQLNPWNRLINSTNKHLYTSINQMRGLLVNDLDKFYDKINTTNVKRHYLAMDFNKVENTEFNNEKYYSINSMEPNNRTILYTPQINGLSMEMPSVPVLYKWDTISQDKICNHNNKDHVCPPNKDYCSCIYRLEFDIGDVVEFVVVDEGFTFQSNHPMHLHGSSFAVLAVDKLNTSIKMDYVKELDEKGKINRNFDRPPIKDTVTVPVGGYTIIRFVTDNPGTWLFHCHLEFHSEIGMSILIKVGKQKDLPPKPIGWPECGNYVHKNASNKSFLISSYDSKSTSLISQLNFNLISCLLISFILYFKAF